MRIRYWSSDVCSSDLFKYSGGHFSRLPPAPGGRTINGHGINDSGLIVGSADSADGTTTEGFILDGSTYAFFSYPGLDRTYARAISADGLVTGYAEDDGFTLNRGFIYRSEEHTSELQSLI